MESVRSFLNEPTDSAWKNFAEAATGDLRAALAAIHKGAASEALAELRKAKDNIAQAKDKATARAAFQELHERGKQWTGPLKRWRR